MEVESDMKQILINRFQIAKDVITSEAEFKKDLGLDSLDVMELVIELENAFNIHIADEDAASILTFGDAVTCVQAGIRPQSVFVLLYCKWFRLGYENALTETFPTHTN
jgi:acyl carrier protein